MAISLERRFRLVRCFKQKKITVLIPTSLSIKQNEVDNQPLIGKQGLQCVSVNDSKAYNDICAMAVDSREYFINIQLDLMDMARKKN